MFEIRVVSMANEMYNDGLYFCEKAKEETNYGDIQRCYRFAIVSFASSFEAFINAQIKSKLQKDATIVNNGANILDFLINGFQNINGIPSELKSIKNKVKLLEQLYTINNNQLIQSTVFNKFFDEVILLRNAIVHYSYSNFTVVYEDQINIAASGGGQLLRDTISDFVNILQIELPDYYSKQIYTSIE